MININPNDDEPDDEPVSKTIIKRPMDLSLKKHEPSNGLFCKYWGFSECRKGKLCPYTHSYSMCLYGDDCVKQLCCFKHPNETDNDVRNRIHS